MTKSALFSVRKNEPCPQCGAELVIRSGKHGPFLGCSHYPDCDYIRPLKSQADGHIVKVLEGQECPSCGAVMVLRQGRFGMFIGCSRYPECEHTELIDKPDETAIACPQCGQGHLVQRRSRFGKTFHSCDRYPDCQFVINFKPVAGECPECHYPLLIERRRRRGSDASVPVNNVESRSRRNKSVNNNLPSEAVAHAVAVLKNEHVIAYPTEAVFGVGCDPDSETAVMRLLELKQRPVEKGLILIAASFEQLKPYIDDSRLSDSQRETIFSCWPGPVTFVFPARPETPRWLTGRFDSLAVRVTNHPLVIELCEAYGKPLVSTSANLTGQPPCRTTAEVHAQFGDSFPVVDGATGGRQNPSEIRDALTGELFRRGEPWKPMPFLVIRSRTASRLLFISCLPAS